MVQNLLFSGTTAAEAQSDGTECPVLGLHYGVSRAWRERMEANFVLFYKQRNGGSSWSLQDSLLNHNSILFPIDL